MLARIAIPIGLFILWWLFSDHWYVCWLKQACPDSDKTEIAAEPTDDTPAAEAVIDNRPFVFNWASPELKTLSSFPSFKDSMVTKLPEGYTFEIIGHYFKGEEAPEGFKNMGEARATKIKDHFKGSIPKNQILVSWRLVDEPEDAASNPFLGASFNEIEPTKEEQVEIVEVDNEITIRFPFNSAKKKADPKVDEYLEKLSKRLAQTEEKVSITGHTDDVGSDSANEQLGRARAKQIRDILVGKGVDKSRISVNSKGESEPVADNGSEAGRQRNRRAVLRIN